MRLLVCVHWNIWWIPVSYTHLSSHKYDIQDYDHVDPHFGVIVEDYDKVVEPGEKNSQAKAYITRTTSERNLMESDALFIRLVEEAHKRGMRVILDGVFNHCGAFHKWLDREDVYKRQDNSIILNSLLLKTLFPKQSCIPVSYTHLCGLCHFRQP